MDYSPEDIQAVVGEAEARIASTQALRSCTSKDDLKAARADLRDAKNALRDMKLFYTRKKQDYTNAEKRIDILIKRCDDEDKSTSESFWSLVRDHD